MCIYICSRSIGQPDPLTSQNIIFVPIQYRLGTLGFLGDGTTEFSGNAALFDMATAVRWVHEYIAFFGGDPRQISIVGHGSGATSAVQLSMSDAIGEDVIRGVVAMSGSAYTQHALDDTPKQSVREIAQINNCGVGNEVEMVRCMRKVDWIVYRFVYKLAYINNMDVQDRGSRHCAA